MAAHGRYPSTIRLDVRRYLKACENLLEGIDGAHDRFMAASKALRLMSGTPTPTKNYSWSHTCSVGCPNRWDVNIGSEDDSQLKATNGYALGQPACGLPYL